MKIFVNDRSYSIPDSTAVNISTPSPIERPSPIIPKSITSPIPPSSVDFGEILEPIIEETSSGNFDR